MTNENTGGPQVETAIQRLARAQAIVAARGKPGSGVPPSPSSPAANGAEPSRPVQHEVGDRGGAPGSAPGSKPSPWAKLAARAPVADPDLGSDDGQGAAGPVPAAIPVTTDHQTVNPQPKPQAPKSFSDLAKRPRQVVVSRNAAPAPGPRPSSYAGRDDDDENYGNDEQQHERASARARATLLRLHEKVQQTGDDRVVCATDCSMFGRGERGERVCFDNRRAGMPRDLGELAVTPQRCHRFKA